MVTKINSTGYSLLGTCYSIHILHKKHDTRICVLYKGYLIKVRREKGTKKLVDSSVNIFDHQLQPGYTNSCIDMQYILYYIIVHYGIRVHMHDIVYKRKCMGEKF